MNFPSVRIVQDIHFLLSLFRVSPELAELETCFMLAETYKYFNLCTGKCRNLQPHSWEADDAAGALV